MNTFTKLIVLLCVLLIAPPSFSQNLYYPFPAGAGGFLQFSYGNGAPVANGWLCTYASSTTNNLTTYSTPTGTANPNPVPLSSSGRANIYLQTLAYTLILYAPGVGNTCNGTTVGALITSENNVLAPTLGPFTGATWNGLPVAALYGGTGLNTSASSGVPSINAGTWAVNSITANGVLYGAAANALSFTAAPPATSVLTVSAGVPTWSATPQITRLGIGAAADGTTSLLINQTTGAASLPTALTGATARIGQANSTPNVIELDSFTSYNEIAGRRATGTIASPTAVVGASLLVLSGGGYDGTNWQYESAYMDIRANETWSGSARGSLINLQTTPNGSTVPVNGLTISGNSVSFNTVGPHAIGGATSTSMQWHQTGAFTGGVNTIGSDLDATLTIPANGLGYGVNVEPAFVEASSGTHNTIAALNVAFGITNGVATTIDAAGINVTTFAAATGTTTASSLRLAAPTGATNNYSLNITSGDVKWGAALVALGGGAAPTLGTIGGSGPATAAQNTWMRVIDSTGAAFWVPAWK